MLASYIFHGDGIGAEFVDALARAKQRGVAVRVLVDDVDVRFSRSSAYKPLRRAGVPVGVFNPPFVPARLNAVHLRNHRKILVVDGRLGFTGGMNIDRRYWQLMRRTKRSATCTSACAARSVAQLAEVFADDWQFTTDEALRGAPWFVPPRAGRQRARARHRGRPRRGLRAAALGDRRRPERGAALGAHHDALLRARQRADHRAQRRRAARRRGRHRAAPKSDLPHVHWAAFGQLWQVLDHGCRVWSSPGPFDHSKLMVVDGAWTLLGSANWDARSLRLNFELNVECYSVEFGAHMDGLVQARINGARRVTLADVNARSLPVKLRDGVARLFAPFL